MRKKILLLILLISSTPSFAKNNGVNVFIVDKLIDSPTLEKKYQVTRTAKLDNSLPNIKERDQFLRKYETAKDLDELSKDLMYMKLKDKKK